MTHYQDRIRETAARLGRLGVNPRLVEAWMRVGNGGCLDDLGGRDWTDEVEVAITCVDRASTEQNESLARSYGLFTNR